MLSNMEPTADAPVEPTEPIEHPEASAPTERWYTRLAERTIVFPLVVFFVHFLIVQITATLAYRYGTSRPSSGPYQDERLLGVPEPMSGFWESIVGPLRLWDGLWYKLIAETHYTDIRSEGFVYGSAKAAFWPLLPWVMRNGERVLRVEPEVVGYLFTHLCFAAALIALYKLVKFDFSPAIARRTLWAIALFPTALFFSAVYTEAPFLLLAVVTLLCARQGNWFMAGVVGLLAALTRSQGIMLLAPMAVLFLQQYRLEYRRWVPNGFFAALPALGPVLFGDLLESSGQNWRAFIDVQGEWNRASSNPIATLRCAFTSCELQVHQYGEIRTYQATGAEWGWLAELWRDPSWSLVTSQTWRDTVANSDTLELVATLLALGLAIYGLFRLPWWMSAYIWPPLIVPLFQPSSVHPLMSMPRFFIVLFPLFIVIAMLTEHRWTRYILTPISILMLIALTIQFSQWYWVS
jgi:hypothetical protein